MKRILVWFRNDLRLRDNEVLYKAAQDGTELVLFYCLDDHYFQEFPEGFLKTGPFRARFILEALAEFRAELKDFKAELVVRKGKTAAEIGKIHQDFPLDAIYYSSEICREEREIELSVKELGLPVQTFHHNSLFHPEDLPFELEKTPNVFTAFRKKLEKYSQVRPVYDKPAEIKTNDEIEAGVLPELTEWGITTTEQDDRRAITFEGGEKAAWERLDHYFWQSEKLKNYKFTRNGLIGADYSSKFSAWLAQGCISARSIFWQIKEFEEKVHKNVSTYWLFFELVWRDFFRYKAMQEGDHFFRMPRYWSPPVGAAFEKWRRGETGQAFVDANMKELLYTGFMSNRGRQNVASYLVKNLKQPWIAGARWFESQLIDHDVSSNYGNWIYVAGIGHDPRQDRYFNVEKQAERYDEKGEYRTLWLEN